MNPQLTSPADLSDEQLIAEVKRLAGCEREATARLVAHLGELDSRRLYLGAGFSSLFAYCTRTLGFSEHEAYNRIEASRAARRFPLVVELLRRGAVHLTAVRMLAPHLAPHNYEGLLAEASGKTCFQVAELLARHFPRPGMASSVRKLVPPAATNVSGNAAHGPVPERVGPALSQPLTAAIASSEPPDACAVSVAAAQVPSSASPVLPQSRRAIVDPLSPDQYRIAFTANAHTLQKLRRAQELLRHQVPDGNFAEIFDRALSALLAEVARRKSAAADRPSSQRLGARGPASTGRHIPAAVKRAVWQRDEGCCAFVAKDGRRCGQREFVEFHHLRPYATDGEPSVRNIARHNVAPTTGTRPTCISRRSGGWPRETMGRGRTAGQRVDGQRAAGQRTASQRLSRREPWRPYGRAVWRPDLADARSVACARAVGRRQASAAEACAPRRRAS